MKTSDRIALVGVSGGIAAYKTADVVSRMVKAGWDVHVLMTPAATRFVGPLTFAALTGHAVRTDWAPDAERESGEALYPHLYPAARADLFLLAPATADIIAKAAHGYADDIVCASILGLPETARKVLCPAMNATMWAQEVVQGNLRILEQRGWHRIGPAEGDLACGAQGPGRMAEPEEIVASVNR
jgi:phosphopantothenoylcysteine synthetase/decarboxylase